MKSKVLTVCALALLSTLNPQPSTAAIGTAFTYQGRLNDGSNPTQGNYDLRFTLYDALSDGTAVGGPLTNSPVGVTNGYFAVTLDFGAVFAGNARWLEIGVRTNGSGAFATLAPRQPLTPSPYALYAPSAGAAATATTAASANAVAAANVTGTLELAQLPPAVVTNNQSGITLTGTFTGNGAGLTNIPFSALPAVPLTNSQSSVTFKGLTTVSNLSVTATNFVNYLVVTNAPALNGSAITNLNASQLTAGTVSLALLPGAVVTNNETGLNLAGTFCGNGAGVTNVDLLALNSRGAIGWTTNWDGFVLASSLGVGNFPTWVISADVNGDGRVDLISVNTYPAGLSVLTNNGSGGLVLASSPAVGSQPSCVVAADVNGDGKLDLITANSGDNTLSVLTNNGSGGFVLAATLAVGAMPYSVTAADASGDGKVDLISANAGDNTLSVLTNNGSGGFVLAATLALGASPYSVTAADVNGDGKVDLISANGGTNTLSVLTNNGGGFTLAATLKVGSAPRCVTAADINEDGKVDLMSANLGANTLSVLTNNGSGGFTLAATLIVGSGPHCVTAADVNGDGKVDLISANETASTLSVLTNNGSGKFVLASSPAVGSYPFSVIAADVNGDGGLDLISANRADNTLSVLFNVLNGYHGLFQGTFTGDGSGLSNLDAADLTGTVADARLSTNVALLNANQVCTGANRFAGAVTLTNLANLLSGTFSGTSAGTFSGNGGGLTNLDAADLIGTVADARLTANVALLNTNQTFSGSNRFAGVVMLTNAANTLVGAFTGNGAGLTSLNASQITSGTLPLAQLPPVAVTNNGTSVTLTGAFSGNGGGLTNLNASNLTGTVADARLTTNVALLNGTNVFAGTNRFAGVLQATNANNQLTGAFTGNGGGLTNLSATYLTGTLADARLSTNVALLNTNQNFTGSNRFAGVIVATNDNNQLAGTFSGTLYGSAPYLKYAEVTANVPAGSAVAGTNNWRKFNVELTDSHNLGSTNGAGDIILPAGTYQCRISSPAFRVQTHQIRLRASTGANLLFGTMGYSDESTGGSEDRSQIEGQFTLAASTTLRVQHWCTLANATDGLGTLVGFDWGDANQTIFAIAEFWKIR